jgi:hypothetical protein
MVINLYNSFNKLFALSLLWLLLEGIFRKWFFPGFSSQLFAVKYALFGLLYVWYYIQSPRVPKGKQLYQTFLFLFVLWCVFQAFNNPLNAPVLVTVFGYINYLFFVPLIAIVPAFFNNIEKYERFVNILAWISIPIYILGTIQYFLPVDHFLNSLVNEEQKFAKVATYTRSLSIFTFVKIYNVYLLFSLSVFFAYLFKRVISGKKILLWAGIIFLGILNMFMTGSRLPTGLMFLFFLLITIYIFFYIPGLRKSIVIIALVGFISSVLLYNFYGTFQIAVDSFMRRAEIVEEKAELVEHWSTRQRIANRIDIFKQADKAGMLGLGIGTTYQGTGMYVTLKRPDISFEEEGERVVLEIGIVGGALLWLVRIFIFLSSLKILLNTRRIDKALLILPLVLYIMPPALFLNNTTFNYFDGFSYWFTFGLILSLKNFSFEDEAKNNLQ